MPKKLRQLLGLLAGACVAAAAPASAQTVPLGAPSSTRAAPALIAAKHGFPREAALENKSVEASASVEPAAAIAVRNGDEVVVKSDDEILPYHQIAVLLFSEEFVNKRADAARRFMRAYIRAVRFYNGALRNSRFQGANA